MPRQLRPVQSPFATLVVPLHGFEMSRLGVHFNGVVQRWEKKYAPVHTRLLSRLPIKNALILLSALQGG